MAYSAQYTSGDISAVSIDLIVGVVATLVGFASLICLVLLWTWLKRQGIRGR
jgi:hypothetical protein